MLTTTADFRLITQDLTRTLNTTAEQPMVSRESEYYLENIGNVESLDDFLADDRLFSFAMRAHGLEEMTYAKAFMRKVLSEGIDEPRSFANSLADPRYADFAETFNFERYGDTATSFGRTGQGTVDKYVRQTLELDAGSQNEGVRLALYFLRKAPEVETTLGLLGDPALLAVTRTALGLSQSMSNTDLDRQVALIEERLDVADLKDPAKLDDFLNRFTTLYELENPTATASAPNVLANQPLQLGISSNILSSLQNLKLGGN